MSWSRSFLIGTTLWVSSFASGCSTDRSTIEIRARSSVTAPEGIAGIRLWLNSREYTADDFARDSDDLLEIFAEVPNSGELQIAMELMQSGEIVAEGSFTLNMSKNFEWGMDLFRQAGDPLDTCFGCSGVRSFTIAEAFQNEPGEAIWFAWGGRPRGSDIVF